MSSLIPFPVRASQSLTLLSRWPLAIVELQGDLDFRIDSFEMVLTFPRLFGIYSPFAIYQANVIAAGEGKNGSCAW
jgi:hypothetical protein